MGLNYYRLRHNHRRYARNLRRFHRFGKPIVITEFGSGSYHGAAQKGPASHDIIDIEPYNPHSPDAHLDVVSHRDGSTELAVIRRHRMRD